MPSQNPLKVVIMVKIRRNFGERMDSLLVPLETREINRTEEKILIGSTLSECSTKF